MKHITSISKWTQESGYKRGVLLPFSNRISSNVQVQLTEIDAGSIVESHYHPSQTEFIYVIDGSCAFVINDKSIILNPGQLLIIEPGETHSTKNSSNIPARFITFKLNGNINDTIWE